MTTENKIVTTASHSQNNPNPIKETLTLLLPLSIIAILFYLSLPIVKPFIFSFIFAYFLNYFVEILKKRLNISHQFAIITTFSAFITIFLTLALWLVPKLFLQILMLLSDLPKYLQQLTTSIEPIASKLFANNPFISYQDLSDNIRVKIFTYLTESVTSISSAIFQSSISIINIFSVVFIIPIITFYFLKDYSNIIDSVKKQLPRNYYRPLISLFKDIDNILSQYLHGQLNVCLILAIFYGTSLQLINLKFGLIIGLLTGFFSFIPFVAVISGLITALAIAMFYWGLNVPYLLLISSIFLIGQFIEGNFITPKLIGNKIGVHPMWIIFGLFFFGSLFGFLGILLAMPLVSIFSVVAKNLIAIYQQYFVKNNS
jgi:putative permease